MKRTAILALWALALPALAGERVNEEQVAACLDRAGAPEDCLAVVLNPCQRMVQKNTARACLYRLRERWHTQIRALGYPGEGAVLRLEEQRSADRRAPGTCGGPGFAARAADALGGELDQWTTDNACAVFRAARAWYGLGRN